MSPMRRRVIRKPDNAPRDGSGDGPRRDTWGLTWHTGAEIETLATPEPQWVAVFVAPEAITEIAAKIKAGKTTYLLAMVSAVVNGEPFLGRATRRSPVVVLTEERPATFRSAMARVGLLGSADVHVLFRREAVGKTWTQVIDAAREKATTEGASLLIIDTLGDWAGIGGDDENSAGAALAAMRPVQAAAAGGLAVVVARHERKSGGDVGDAARGSSAFGGAADVLLSLRRADGQGHDDRRVIHAVGRFDGIPSQLVIEWTGATYRSLGEDTAVELRDARSALRGLLQSKTLTEAEIIEHTDASRGTAKRALTAMIEDGEVIKITGLGKTGRAFGYRLGNGLIERGKEADQSITTDDEPRKSTDQPPLEDGQSVSPSLDCDGCAEPDRRCVECLEAEQVPLAVAVAEAIAEVERSLQRRGRP